MYKGVKINAFTLIPEIVDVDFEIRHSESLNSDWIYVTTGAVTGYESVEWRKLTDDYPNRSVFTSWIACAGTLNKYHRLEIPMSEVIKFLENQGLITIEREYGYIKKIIQSSASKVKTE